MNLSEPAACPRRATRCPNRRGETSELGGARWAGNSELQGRIRAAALGASEARRRLSIGVGGTLLVSYWIWLLTLPVPSDLFLRPAPWLMLLGFGAPFLAATLVAMPAAAALRAHRRQALRRELAPIPRERLAAVLVPLRDDPSPDTRMLVAPLIRDLLAEGLEMAPAEGSAGSGDEVAAAGLMVDS